MTTTMHIDWTACDGRGVCVELLPEVLAEDDWGYPLARDGGGSDPRIPAELRGHAERAVGRCPRMALRLGPPADRREPARRSRVGGG